MPPHTQSNPLTLKEILHLREEWEGNGRHALGVRLTPSQAQELRRELHHLYGQDPGPRLTTLYGMEVLQTDAGQFSFEG